MMEFLTELATSGGGIGAVVSGVTGLLGGWLTKRENRLMTIEDNKHELAMADVEKEMAKFEFDANVKMAQMKKEMTITEAEIALDQAETEGQIKVDIIDAETERAIEEAAGDAMRESIKAQNTLTGNKFVDNFRSMTRPLLTWSIFLFTVVIFVVLHVKVGSLVAEDTELLVSLYVYIVQAVIYLFILITSWWFMSRGDKAAENIKKIFGR